MKRSMCLVAVMFVLIALVLASGMGEAGVSQTIAEPLNTPPPLSGEGPEVQLLPDSFGSGGAPQVGGALVMDQMVQQSTLYQDIDIDAISQTFGPIDANSTYAPSDHPAAPNEVCWDVLLNPQLDVVEFGDGTGSISHWTIYWQKVYYDNTEYNSANYSLVMVDDPSNDTDIINTSQDLDMFLQAFNTPGNLTSFQITYNRLYAQLDSSDQALYRVWALDDQGYLDYVVTDTLRFVGEGADPYSWDYRGMSITDPVTLTLLSNQSLAVSFEMWADRLSPYEVVWLDDIQVTLCAELNNTTYLPLTFKAPPQPVGCNPIEPDSVDNRGSTVVGSTCNGAFNTTDTEDYYSLDLDGATDVRLWLKDLPAGTNWTALIYRDLGGGDYERICYIGTPGDADKYEDCDGLNASYDYFVRVYAGDSPNTTQTYSMSVVRR